MRTTLVLDRPVPVVPALLLREERFLYRRIADQGRAVLGIGVHEVVDAPSFDQEGRAMDWTFGALPYEWIGADGTEARRADGGPISQWWIPKWVVEWRGQVVYLHVHPAHVQEIQERRDDLHTELLDPDVELAAHWTERTDRTNYMYHVDRLMRHIQRGDIYEVNYCVERFGALAIPRTIHGLPTPPTSVPSTLRSVPPRRGSLHTLRQSGAFPGLRPSAGDRGAHEGYASSFLRS
jgi:hypothetical protein